MKREEHEEELRRMEAVHDDVKARLTEERDDIAGELDALRRQKGDFRDRYLQELGKVQGFREALELVTKELADRGGTL